MTADTNAAALETAAAQREQKAAYETELADRKFTRQEGHVRASIGQTGLATASFSDVLADDAAESALEKLAIKAGGKIEANNLRFQAAGQRVAGQNAIVESLFGVGSAVAGKYKANAQLDAIRAKGVTVNGGWNTDTSAD